MSIGQYFYKIRRKADGKFSKGGYWVRFGRLGKAYSMFGAAITQFNICGGGDRWNPRDAYAEHELVKFGPGGEIIVWTGSKCTLTSKDGARFEPNSMRTAGIKDELGELVDKIDAAQEAIKAGQSFEFDALFSEIDVKQFKLQAALDELAIRNSELRASIKKIYLGDDFDLD
jgi:hypothetical protein